MVLPETGEQTTLGLGSVPSVAVAANVTTAPDGLAALTTIGVGTVSVGALRSILFPPIGPALAQLFTLSHTLRASVGALAVSLPSGTLVESEKLASLLCARPDALSLAVHAIDTSAACQAASRLPQLTVGASRSTRMPASGPAV